MDIKKKLYSNVNKSIHINYIGDTLICNTEITWKNPSAYSKHLNFLITHIKKYVYEILKKIGLRFPNIGTMFCQNVSLLS